MNLTVSQWLNLASKKLAQAEIPSARLDSELILARVLNLERTALHARPDKKLTKQQYFHANNWLKKRSKRIPLAYIFGEKEFYGRKFFVNSNVLVPRPETENLIDCIKNLYTAESVILDVGTGSGIIPISILAEFRKDFEQNSKVPEVFASDISLPALAVANLNAKKILNEEIPLFESDLLEKIPSEVLSRVSILTANLPYVSKNWIDFSKENELHHEPQIALYARENGLELIKKLIEQTPKSENLKYLALEADPEQFIEIEETARKLGFSKLKSENYTIVFKK